MSSRWLLGLLLALVAAGSMWLYFQRVLIPYQVSDALAKGKPRGNLSDLYPRWLGARELLLHKRDPYGADITREIQIGYYGRPVDPTRLNDPKDQQAFAYPLYIVLILAPTVGLPFETVQRACFWLFVVLTSASVVMWLQTLGWRLSTIAKLTWVLLTMSSLPAIQGLKLQQLTVLVAALVAAFINAIVRRQFVWAGVLLALATIKPQLVCLLVVWLFLWVVGRWRERQRLLWGFAGTMAVLVGVSEILLPGWILDFRAAMASYYQYTGGGNSILNVVLTPTLGRITSAILVGVFLMFAWKMRHADETAHEFQWSLSIALATTLLVIPMFPPNSQLLLVLPFMMFVRSITHLWRGNQVSRFFVMVTALSVFWPFLAAAFLVGALIVLPGTTVQRASVIPFYSTLAVPLTMYAMLLSAKNILISKNPDPSEQVARTLRQSVTSE